MINNLKQIKRIYFIGIGGIGMSSIAALAKEKGFLVGGSNSAKIYSPASTILSKNRIPVNSKEFPLAQVDLVVLGGGEPGDHPEIKKALELGLKIISFPELLYLLTKEKHRLVICGTHGKTTTSALIAKILTVAGFNPGFFIGGLVRDFQSNFHYSDSKYFIIEGDEYYSSALDRKAKFLHYRPETLVLTNLEMDHFDFYHNLGDLVDKFNKLVNCLPPTGTVIANADDSNIRKLLKNCQKNVIWYGLKNKLATWKATKLKYSEKTTAFQVSNPINKENEEFDIPLGGQHNVLNALAAMATASFCGCSGKQIKSALSSFQGLARRFEIIAQKKGVMIIDDYAHHATAVRATLNAARQKYPQNKIWAIFEPHTFSRTKAMLPELGKAFAAADQVIIPDIYPAREKDQKQTIHAREVVKEISRNQTKAIYLPSQEKILKYLIDKIKKNDLIIIMAVGNFNALAKKIASKI